MNEHACSEEDVLCKPEAAGIAHLPTSGGTFSLRRALYFTKPGAPPLGGIDRRALTGAHQTYQRR